MARRTQGPVLARRPTVQWTDSSAVPAGCAPYQLHVIIQVHPDVILGDAWTGGGQASHGPYGTRNCVGQVHVASGGHTWTRRGPGWARVDCEDSANAKESMEEYGDLGGTSGMGREGHRGEDRDTPSLLTILYTPV